MAYARTRTLPSAGWRAPLAGMGAIISKQRFPFDGDGLSPCEYANPPAGMHWVFRPLADDPCNAELVYDLPTASGSPAQLTVPVTPPAPPVGQTDPGFQRTPAPTGSPTPVPQAILPAAQYPAGTPPLVVGPDGTILAATQTPRAAGSWLSQSSIISGIPNWEVLAGGFALVFVLRGRRS